MTDHPDGASISRTRAVDYLIIGGGIAGTTAAETIRKHAEGSVTIVTDEPHTLYSRVRLPDYVAAQIPRDRVFMKDTLWYRDRRIELLRQRTVTRLSVPDQSVELSDGSILRYGSLLLAMGGAARRLSCPGAGWSGLHYLRTLDDADRILAAIPGSTRAVVIGGGFIGIEMARCFAQHGRNTDLVLMEPRFWANALDEASSGMIERTLRSRGVAVHYSEQIDSIQGDGAVRDALLASGKRLTCDLMGVGIGISTLHPFVKEAGLAVRRGVVTDEYLRTSDPRVFAAGDIAEFMDLTRGRSNQIGNWSNALEQGRTAGLNMAGEATPYRFVSNYVITIFGLSVGFAGDPTAHPDTEIVRRGAPEQGSYSRIFVRDGRITGATVLNAPKDNLAIGQLIRHGVRIDETARLADPGLDLRSLLRNSAA